jgi:hypothetical protein
LLHASSWFLAYSSTLKTEATYSSETSAEFQRTTWSYIAEDQTVQGMSYCTEFEEREYDKKSSCTKSKRQNTSCAPYYVHILVASSPLLRFLSSRSFCGFPSVQ